MRRMYSEQELTNTIKAVFEQELADGALDQNVSDAVDAYLVEHPVDITALEGQDVEVKSIEATDAIKYLSKIVDEDGHPRFLEGNITLSSSMTMLTLDYGKWSLSGTHLMFVIAGHVADEAVIPAGYIANLAGTTNIPQWILDKIFPMSGGTAVDYKQVNLFDNGLNTQTMNVIFYKISSTSIGFYNRGSVTLTANRDFRIVCGRPHKWDK